MPVSPATPEALALRVLLLYLQAERILLAKIARRIKRGITEEGWAERKLAEVQAMRREARQEVARLEARARPEIRSVIDDSYRGGIAELRRDIAALGREAGEVAAANPRLLRMLVELEFGRTGSTHLRILRWVDDVYRRVIAEASGQVLAGTVSRREAAQRALNSFADRGVTGFVDSAGRQWDLASYTEMSIRTSAGQASVAGYTDSIQSLGEDLVIVSDAPQECPLCRPWEGRTLSLSGLHPRFPSIEQATNAGLFHPNCRHTIGIFIEGFTRPFGNTADPIGFEARQQQRYLERGVRRWKRRGAVGDPAAPAATQQWQRRLDSHVAANDLKRQRQREAVGAR